MLAYAFLRPLGLGPLNTLPHHDLDLSLTSRTNRRTAGAAVVQLSSKGAARINKLKVPCSHFKLSTYIQYNICIYCT